MASVEMANNGLLKSLLSIFAIPLVVCRRSGT